MKKVTVFFAVLMLLALTVVSAFALQTGVSGQLWDSKSPAATWKGGASVYAAECDAAGVMSGDIYASQQVAAGAMVDGVFDMAWGVNTATGAPATIAAPVNGDYVCLYVDWEGDTNGSVASFQSDAVAVITFVNGRMSFGNIHSGTGPTAVTLQNVTADSNTTAAVGIGFVVLMLAGVTFVAMRRREVA